VKKTFLAFDFPEICIHNGSDNFITLYNQVSFKKFGCFGRRKLLFFIIEVIEKLSQVTAKSPDSLRKTRKDLISLVVHLSSYLGHCRQNTEQLIP
jgi:hypothetical protein